MRVDVATGWSHLQELLFEESWNEQLGRFRSGWTFRGLSDASYPLDTTLQRLGPSPQQFEHHLIRNFKKYAHRDVVERDSHWHWLSMAQHHGLPTRLLDWTYSPLVAMHFATANTEKFDRDGVVWCIHYERTHALLPDRIKHQVREEGANSFTTEMLDESIPSFEHFASFSEEPFLLFFEPPSMDDRIVNQFALFSVMSRATERLDAWMERHPDLCRKVVIPAALKWEIRDKLDQCNVTERVMFPGLDGLTRWLHRHYRPVKERGETPAPGHGG